MSRFPFAVGVPLNDGEEHQHADGSTTLKEYTPFVFSPPCEAWDRMQQNPTANVSVGADGLPVVDLTSNAGESQPPHWVLES